MIKANPANKALTKPLSEIRESLFQEFPPEARGTEGWAHLNEILNSKTLPQREWKALAEARTIMNRVKTGLIGPDEALTQLKSVRGGRASTNESIDYAVRLMKDPDYVLHESPQALKSAMDNVNSMLANPANSTVKRALTLTKNALGHQINKAEPAYGAANKVFSEMSAPINQIDVAGGLYDRFVPAITERGLSSAGGAGSQVRANAFADALRKAGASTKSMTGRNLRLDQVMTPQQMATLRGIESDLARSAAADALAASKGSPTNQNEVINALIDLGKSKIPGGNTVLKIGKALSPQSRVNDRIAEMLLDPEAYIRGAGIQQTDVGPLIEALRLRGINPALLGANASE